MRSFSCSQAMVDEFCWVKRAWELSNFDGGQDMRAVPVDSVDGSTGRFDVFGCATPASTLKRIDCCSRNSVMMRELMIACQVSMLNRVIDDWNMQKRSFAQHLAW